MFFWSTGLEVERDLAARLAGTDMGFTLVIRDMAGTRLGLL